MASTLSPLPTDPPPRERPRKAPRLGPRPLPLHLTTALYAWLSLPTVWPSLKSASLELRPDAALASLRARARQLANEKNFTAALAKETARRARRFVKGIVAYQNHPATRRVPEAHVVWLEGTTRLLDYNPAEADAPAVLVIPSLINRFDILDLERDHSFLRALAIGGFRPLAVDWGAPGETEKDFALEDYVKGRLAPILDHAGKGGRIHVLGYCMGGLLALALAALKPEKIRTLSLFATPWDFHQPDPAQGQIFLDLAKQLAPELDRAGHLPVDVIQGLFAALQPLQAMQKFSAFAELDQAGIEARRFVLLEDWLQDGVPLAAKVAKECIADWYGRNLPAKFEWRIENKIVDPRAMAMPAYVAVPGRDHIVPPESALPLAKLFSHAALHEPMTGHIGMMASSKAPHQVWGPYFHWLKQHA